MRKREFRSSIVENIPGNYYPMVSNSIIKDEQIEMTIMSSRSHGVSSQNEGELEVMLHRRLSQTDSLGNPTLNFFYEQ
jgi:hypothetical protein